MPSRKPLVIILSAVSLSLYLIHFLIFRDSKDIFFYGLMDIAFIPISVLLVSMVIERVIARREKEAMLFKMNMVIGVFFSEVGRHLLGECAAADTGIESFRKELLITPGWKAQEFGALSKKIPQFTRAIDVARVDLGVWQAFLREKRPFLVGLLQNGNLLEHEAFTELLWAVFHLAEEISIRRDLTILSSADAKHLAGDISRAYSLLITEWCAYMKHLSVDYPYLFSLAIRTNPFDPHAQIEINS